MVLSHQEAIERVHAERLRQQGGYFEIPTSVFVEKVDVNMAPLPPVAFYTLDDRGEFQLLRRADQPYSPLALSAHEHIWVSANDFPVVRGYAENQILRPVTGGSAMPVESRMEALRKSAMMVVEDLFDNPTPENVNRSVKVVSNFVYVLMKDPKAYLLLAKLSSHDPYTLQHSVGTAVNSIILARKIGINGEQELLEVGLGGLLHDIGKTKVKKEIINKPGPLDENEWEEMRSHPGQGWEIVKDNPTLSDRTKLAIRDHHEEKNGTGYPAGKKGNETDIYAKIVCICDIFNALTTNRSYSKARTPFEAFHFMREKLAHKFDDELFRQLVMVYGGKVE